MNWHDGLPAWLEPNLHRERKAHLSVEARHAMAGIASPVNEIITVVWFRSYSPCCWEHGEETVDTWFEIYVSRQKTDDGDGSRNDAEDAFSELVRERNWILEE